MATASARERQLGDLLVEMGVLTPLELDEALQRQRLTGEMLGRVLVKMGLCQEQDVIEALAVQNGMERVDLGKLSVKDEILHKIEKNVAQFYEIVPIRELPDSSIVVAMADPLNMSTLDDLRHILGVQVRGAVSNAQDVAAFIERNYSRENESVHQSLQDLIGHVGDAEYTLAEAGTHEIVGDADNLVALAQEPEIIKIVNLCLLEAVQKRASDIHFETYDDSFRIRIRVDGVLHEVVSPPKNLALALVSRVKVMSSMDISERRLPQDARIEMKIGDTMIDVRIASLPTLYGENIVMRILDRTAVQIDLNKLGFHPQTLKRIHSIIRRPNGIFLVTGPTGSGKTTSLYACVETLNKPDVKIITTEDPVELQLDRIVQVQVKEEMGLTFAACLRSILRQDPDIVMVGEIRDLETAQIAIEASLTGHLVLSTLHTNSAPETITRLLDMDVEPFLITSSLAAVLAQRLIRVVCRHCCESYRPDPEEMDQLGLPDAWRTDQNLRFRRAKGCPACDFVGYMGRVGLFELLVVDETISDMILNRAMAFEIRNYARRAQGMRTLREEGIIKCAQGITSAEEIFAHTDAFENES
jgi:type IV pilus assembly protein PilB